MPAKALYDTRSPLYRAWTSMKQRCYNPNAAGYSAYGGRGITVCQRWLGSYEAFAADMGERPTNKHSLDRYNNDLGYTPGNCRWATPLEQRQNTQRAHWLAYDGDTQPLSVWAERWNLSPDVLRYRLNRYGLDFTKLRAPSVRYNMQPGANLTLEELVARATKLEPKI